MSYEKIVLITRKTRLQDLVERFNTVAQAKFYLEHSGGSFEDYQDEDRRYREVLQRLRKELSSDLKIQEMDRSLLPTYVFGPRDLVVTVGQDGLVANTAKYVKGQPILAVNPDRSRYDGVLLPFQAEEARAGLERLLKGKARLRAVTLARAETGDGQSLLAFNDLFVGARSHVSARYRISAGGRSERQSSSGIIISTGAGSTGWLSSVFIMASNLTRFAGGEPGRPMRCDWAERRLIFVVREPFASRVSQTDLAAGVIAEGQKLVLESHMPTGGVVFSDGMESDYIDFNSGCRLEITVAAQQAQLVV